MKRILSILGMVVVFLGCHAQTIDKNEDFEAFRRQIHEDFENFRKEINQEFIEFVRNPWKEFESEDPIPKPKEDTIPPVVIPQEDKAKPIEDKPVIIEEVITPAPVEPQPQPVEPIEEVPVISEKYITFTFFGTQCKVRYNDEKLFKLNSLSQDAVADALAILCSDAYENMLVDCLEIRKKLQLCDWAYLELLRTVADNVFPKGSNEATLLMAYIYVQSGYRMRLAHDGQRLYMLFASKHIIYEYPSYTVDGELYYGTKDLPSRLYISQAAYKDEKNLSMLIPQPQKFAVSTGNARSIKSQEFKGFEATVRVNKNLIDFYSTYPPSYYGNDFMTIWATYANTPMNEAIQKDLYVQLKEKIDTLDQLSAVTRLLNWVQTGFVYEYDDKVWGGDRAFFSEETLYYPYCDCEDRSILLSKLVRDLLGLKVLLIYYPGHLATAIRFTEEVTGDYISLGGEKYVVADPTYINAPVGKTMPRMDNKTAKVILLQ